MTNLSRHPILRAIYDASQAVERCGASVELTDAVMSVTALYPLAEDLLDRIATLEAERDEARRERDKARDTLYGNGFVPCDIPACNCGRWHWRYGWPERWQELKDDLEAAGHPLCNANGNNLRRALGELVAAKESAESALAEAAAWIRVVGEEIDARGDRTVILAALRQQRAELAEARKDAERYRWLRDKSANQWVHPIVVSQSRDGNRVRYLGPILGAPLDAAIDSAIEAEKGDQT